MSNPIFNQFGNQPNNFVTQFNQFKQMFHGDAKQQVQQLLNSGRISQSQYDRAVQMANQMMKMFK